MNKKESNIRPASSVKVAYSAAPPPIVPSLSWVESKFKQLEDRISKLELALSDNGIYID